MLKVVEFFGGIGSFTKAMKLEGIDFELVDYVDLEQKAVQCYNAMNGTNFEIQNIKEWDKNVEIDVVYSGSPCQSLSKNGKKDGAKRGSGTTSSVVWYKVDIVERLMPKIVIWENVANVRSFDEYGEYLDKMESLGYHNYSFDLDAKYLIPQKRNRTFTVSSLKPIDEKRFANLRMIESGDMPIVNNVKDYLREDYVGKKFEMKDGLLMPLWKRNMMLIRTGTKQGYNEVYPGDVVDLERPTSKTRRARVVKGGICPTITTSKQIGVVQEDLSVRYLTALEAYLLQGFSEDDYNKCVEAGVSENEIYARAGNSIAVPVSRAVVRATLKGIDLNE